MEKGTPSSYCLTVKEPTMMPQMTLFKFILGFAFCLGIQWSAQAQNYDPKAKEFTIRGQQALLEHKYENAYKQFDRALDFAPTYTPAMHGMAAANELLGRFAEAVGWYDRVLVKDPRYSRILFFEAGRVHFTVGNYQKALDLFYEFLALQELPPTDFGLLGETELAIEQAYLTEIQQLMNACRLASDLDQFKTIRSISNLGPNINTAADEYFPYLTNDQNLLFYTRRADKFSDEDLFYSSSFDALWQTGQSVSSNFNTPKNEGMSTLVQNGKKMFFTACNRKAVKGPCDIWEATLDGHSLRQIHELPGDLNSDSWESQASISCDGTTLYFSSNREDGQGGTDIWVSSLDEEGNWSEPENMGPNVNSNGDEEAPFITNDGETLYFSSTGHTGLGEQDIFMSRKGDDGVWSKPVNLGPPVNSSYRELGFFLSADGRRGYFASDRDGGQGGMDIYEFELPQELIARPITFVELVVLDSFTRKPVPTTIYTKTHGSLPTDEEGKYFLCLEANQPFSFTILENDYQSYYKRIDVPEWDNTVFFSITALLDPLEPPTVKEIESMVLDTPSQEIKHAVYFDFNKHELNAETQKDLEFFIEKVLHRQAVDEVEIVGYSDQIGSDRYNMILSEKRAKTVAVFLKNRGIRVDRVYIEGGGEITESIPDSEKRKVEIIFTMR